MNMMSFFFVLSVGVVQLRHVFLKEQNPFSKFIGASIVILNLISADDTKGKKLDLREKLDRRQTWTTECCAVPFEGCPSAQVRTAVGWLEQLQVASRIRPYATCKLNPHSLRVLVGTYVYLRCQISMFRRH